MFVRPSQEGEPAAAVVEKGWEEVETQRGEEEEEGEEQGQGLLCEEAEEAELACSMQYDEEELEQLNMMVYRVGDEMSTLLSPPSQGQSPAHRPPQRGEAGGSSGASSTEASPRRLLAGRTGVFVEEEDRVFLMDDLDAAGEAITSISREACSCSASHSKGPRPVQRKPGPRPDATRNGWGPEAQSEQPCPQPRAHPARYPSAKRPPCTSAPGPEPLPYANGWEVGLEGPASETAEVIAHRMGGMKLSATVIFNPRSPSLTELAVDKLLLPRPAPSEMEPCGPLVATHCLLNSCVCCGSCEDGHDDAVATETASLGLGLALGLDRHCKTAAPGSVIQASACRLPPRGRELSRLTPPSARSRSAETLEEESEFQLCEKCLGVAPGPQRLAQDGGSRASPCSHQPDADRRLQASGGRLRDKEAEKDTPGTNDFKRETKEDGRRSSR